MKTGFMGTKCTCLHYSIYVTAFLYTLFKIYSISYMMFPTNWYHK